MSQAVELRGACVDAGSKRILGPVDLALQEGEHVLVVGRSGAGKTTLLRAIAGLARLACGSVSLFGQIASQGPRLVLEPDRRGIGFLFQGGALWPHWSAGMNLRFVLARRGLSRAERSRRARELLELVELTGFEARSPATLSGGEAQRLALARALASEPRILLLDEPLGPLDQDLRGEMLARLAELTTRLRLSVLHVTHDARESAALASRVLRMEGGRIVDEGRPGKTGELAAGSSTQR